MNTSIGGGGGGSHTDRVSNPISRFSFGHYAILLLLIPIVLLTCGYAVDPLQAIAVTDPDDLVRITSFDLHADNTDASGITYDGTHLFVTDLTASKVFVYDLGGNHIRDYETTADQSGIGFGNDVSYVVTDTNKVYIDDPSDSTFSSQFKDFGSDGGHPVGITVSNGLLVVNSTSVSHYGFNSSTAFPTVAVINGIFIKPDGTSMYISTEYQSYDDDVNKQYDIAQYDLSTPWDTSTATSVPGFNEQNASGYAFTNIHNVHFSTNGSLVYYVSYNGNTVHQYGMSTPWDLNTAVSSSASEYSNVTLTEPVTKSITFNTLGSVMYIGSTRSIYQFNLTTPWDVTTAVYDSKSKMDPSEIKSISFDPSGTKLYMASGTYGSTASQYTLSTPWDVTTASLDGKYTVAGIVNADSDTSNSTAILSDLFFDSTGTIVYFTDKSQTVYQYNTLTPWDITNTTVGSRLLFNLTDTNHDPTGIAHVDKTVFITDNNPPSVYQYMINGDLLLDGSMLHAQNDDPVGITSIGANYLYVADANGNKIHVYDLASDFSTPDAPTNLSVSATRTVALLSWNESFDGGTAIIGYTVEYLLSDANGWVQVQNGNKSGTDSLQISITDLVAGTEYKFRVAAVNSNGTGSFSANATATTLPDKPGKPTGLVAIPSDTSVSLSWTAPSDNGATITDYTVEYVDIDGDNTWILFSDGSSDDASATVTGLTVRTDYKFRVAAINSIGTGSYSENATATTLDVPSKPTGLVAIPSDTSVSLSWTAPSDNGGAAITDYTVEYVDIDGDNTWIPFSDGSSDDASATVTGLTVRTDYKFRVAAINSIGTGSYSENATATTLDVPSKPTGLVAVPSDTSVSLSWTAPSDNGGAAITDYTVEYVDIDGDNTWILFSDGSSDDASATVTGLTVRTDYKFRVAAINSIGTGSYSENATATTLDVPGKPTGLVAVPSDTSVSLSWTAPSDNGGAAITDYTVEYVDIDGDNTWILFSDGSSDDASATVTGLTVRTDYKFRVAAINSIGTGSYSENAPATTLDVPSKPTGLVAIPSDTSVSLSWTAPSDNGGAAITDYTVEYVDIDGDNTWIPFSDGSSDDASATVTGLTVRTDYKFRVAAINSIGTGSYSENASATTLDVPSKPTGLVAVPSDTSVSLSWTAPSDNGGAAITDYAVEYVDIDGDNTWILFSDGSSDDASATVTGLTVRTDYKFRVAAINSIGTGSYSENAPATTLDVSSKPTGLVAVPSDTSVSLSWTAPSDNGGAAITDYAVEYVDIDGDNTWILFSDGSSADTSATVTGLTVRTDYKFRVAAVSSIGTGSYSENASATTLDVPSKPTGLVATANYTSVSLSWTAPSDNGGNAITGYTVDYAKSNDTWQTQDSASINNSTRETTIIGLTSSTQYNFRVAAINNVGQGAYSANTTIQTVTITLPGAPTVSVGTVTYDSITITWTPPSNTGGGTIVDYTVDYAGSDDSDWTNLRAGTGTNSSTTATASGLSNGTSYTFRVAAVNSAGTGAYSANVTVTATDLPLVRITSFDLHADNTDASGITYDGTHLFVTDLTASKVFVYDVDGNHIRNYETTADQSGIGFGNDVSYVVTDTNKVYIDDPSDSTFSSQFKDFGSDGGHPVGITVSNGLLVVDSTSVSHYGFNSSTTFLYVYGANGIFIKPDGTSMYISTTYPSYDVDVVKQDGITQYDLSTPWDTSTATVVNGFSEQDARNHEYTRIHDVHFSTNGSLVYYVSYNGDTVYQYGMSTPWDLSTTVSSSASEYSTDELTNLVTKSITFNTLGSMMYIGSAGYIYQFSLTTPWDVTTAVYDYKSKMDPSEIKSISFDPSGTKLYMASGPYGAAASQYTLSTPWDVRTTSLDGKYTVVGIDNADSSSTADVSVLTDLFFDSTGTIVYFTDKSQTVYQYNTLTPWDITNTTVGSRLLFDLDDANHDPTGITHVDKTVFITDNNPPSVYQYVINGDLLLDGSMLHAQNDDPVGITSNGATYLYVADANGNKIHVYDLASDFGTPAVPTKPGAPARLTTSTTLNSIDLSWNVPESNGGDAITGYTVQYTTASNTEWETHLDGTADDATPSTTTTITGLTHTTEYTFRVAAVNRIGQGTYSANVTDTTKAATVPGVPTAITIIDTTINSLLVAWSDPSDDGGSTIIGYTVDYAVAPSGTWQTQDSALVNNDTKNSTITGLTPNTEYNFRVAAVNSVGQGAYSANATKSTNALTVPGTLTISTSDVGYYSIDITWDAPSNIGGSPITAYVVEHSAAGAAWEIIRPDDPADATTTETISNLIAGSKHAFRVAAVNVAGQGVYSNTLNVTTTDAAKPGTLTISTSDVGYYSIDITWDAPSNIGGSPITAYVVEHSAAGAAWEIIRPDDPADATTTETISNLIAGSKHAFRVAAVNVAGQGVYSNTLNVTTTDAAKPGTLTISTSDVGYYSIDITWDAPSNIGGSPITAYVVEHSAAGAAWEIIRPDDPADATTTETISNLIAGSKHAFRVAAVNVAGQGVYSNTLNVTTTDAAKPGTLTISTSDVGYYSISISRSYV